jgi:hypothetical protein
MVPAPLRLYGCGHYLISFLGCGSRVAPGLPAAVKAATDTAGDVGRKSRFLSEAIALLNGARLLSCSLPTDLGGRSYGIAELAVIARALGGHAVRPELCLRCAIPGALARPRPVTARLSYHEMTTGGDVRSSTCAGDQIVLETNAPLFPVPPSRARSLREKQAARGRDAVTAISGT